MITWRTDFLRNYVSAIFFSIAVFAPLLWMALDRTPPIVRTSGKIEANSGPPDFNYIPGNPVVGGWVNVVWYFRTIRTCPQAYLKPIYPIIIDSSGGIHNYEATKSLFDWRDLDKVNELSRQMRLPVNMPSGRTAYSSTAWYACNVLHQLWPIGVTGPTLYFEVDKP